MKGRRKKRGRRSRRRKRRNWLEKPRKRRKKEEETISSSASLLLSLVSRISSRFSSRPPRRSHRLTIFNAFCPIKMVEKSTKNTMRYKKYSRTYWRRYSKFKRFFQISNVYLDKSTQQPTRSSLPAPA